MAILTTAEFLTRTYTSEDKFTADTNMWVSHNYETLRGMYYHIPNESFSNDVYRMKLYAMGLLPGAPDFCFLLRWIFDAKYIRDQWYLELKLPKRTLSKSQEPLHKRWQHWGYVVHTAWHPGEVVEICRQMLGNPRY